MKKPINSTLTQRPALLGFLLALIFIFSSIANSLHGQVAGVGTNLRLWYRADVGHNCILAGPPQTPAPLPCNFSGVWQDQDPTFQDATQVGPGNIVYNIPEINFNEAFETSGNGFAMSLTSNPTDITIFAVLKTTDADGVIISGDSIGTGGTRDWSLKMNAGQVEWSIERDGAGPVNVLSTTTNLHSPGSPFLVCASRTDAGSTDSMTVWINGLLESTGNGPGNALDRANNIRIGQNPGGSNQLDAKFSEIIVYHRFLSFAEIRRINSYLAIKYGITLPHDYTDQTPTTLFTNDGTHVNNIFGIGTYIGGSFIQPLSESVTEANGVTLFNGGGYGGVFPIHTYETVNPPFSNGNTAGDYLMMGHDNGGEDFTVDYNGSCQNRLGRVYRMENTGINTAVTLRLDSSVISGLDVALGGFGLIVDNNPAFSSFNGPSALSYRGNGLWDVEFTPPIGLSYWTLIDLTPVAASNAPFPSLAGITDCSLINNNFTWYRADTVNSLAFPNSNAAMIVTDIWEDQSTNQTNLIPDDNPDSLNFPFFDFNEINFNPVLRTDVVSTSFPSFAKPSFGTAYGEEMTLAVVMKTNDGGGGVFPDQPTIFGSGGGPGSLELTLNNGTVNWSVEPGSDPRDTVASLTTHNNDIPFLVFVDRSNVNDSMRMWIDGVRIPGIEGGDGSTPSPAVDQSFAIQDTASGLGHLNADFAEIVMFDGIMTLADREKLASYLAIKYGLNLGHAYTNSAGATIYAADGYSNGVVGLANEDATGSDYTQLQSHSAGDTSITFYAGHYAGLYPDRNYVNPKVIPAQSYLLTGHNDLGLTLSDTFNFVPNSRIGRIFKIEETNNALTLATLRFETPTGSPYNFLAGSGNWAFVLSSDTTFAAPTDQVILLDSIAAEDYYVEFTVPAGISYWTLVDLDAPRPVANPGGANGQDLTIWLRADTGHNQVSTTGANTGQWFDNSFTGNPGFFSTANQTQTFGNQMNFNEGIQTASSSFVDFKRTSVGNLSMAVVYKADFSGILGPPFGSDAAIVGGHTATDGYYLVLTNGQLVWVQDPTGALNENSVVGSAVPPYGTGRTHIAFTYRDTITDEIGLRVDGQDFGPTAITISAPLNANDSLRLGQHPDGGGVLDGTYGELMIFDDLISSAEQEQLETYLAIKFGVTLVHDYFDHSGTNIYSLDTFDTRVLGLGKEDFSASNYHQTVSVSDGDSSLIACTGIGFLGIPPTKNDTNASNNPLTDDTYLVFGDNDGSVNFNRNLLGNPNQLMDRTWKVTETGALTTVSVFFDESWITSLAAPGNYSLIISSNTDFDDGMDTTIFLDNAGTGYYYKEVDFPDNATSYFSIINTPVPAGVAGEEVEKWFDGNFHVDNTTGIKWGPRSGIDSLFSTNATTTYGIGTANFNSTIELTSDYLKTRHTQDDSLSMFIVFRSGMTVNQNGYPNGPALISGVKDESGDNFGLRYRDNGDITWRVEELSTTNNRSETFTGSYLHDSLHIAYVSFHPTNGLELGIDGNPTANTAGMPVGLGEADSLRLGRFNPSLGGTQEELDGDIAEFIEFGSPLLPQDRQMVMTYLAIKYGVTLDHNYLEPTSGVTIYNITDFDTEIIGVAKDAESFLDQRASQPAHNSTGLGIVLGPAGDFPVHNDSVLTTMPEDHYLIIGHDNNSTNQYADFNGSGFKRMTRIYKAIMSGTTSSVDATLIFNGGFGPMFTGLGSDSSLVMVVSADTLFDINDNIVQMNELTALGAGVYSAQYTFNFGDSLHISVAKVPNPLRPGGVPDPVSVWVQANTGYTDNGNIDTWENIANLLNPVEQQNGAISGGVLQTATPLLNFNPYLTAGQLRRNLATQAAVNSGTYIAVMLATGADSAAGYIGQSDTTNNIGFQTHILAQGDVIEQGFRATDFTVAPGQLWANGGGLLPVAPVDDWSILSGNSSFSGTPSTQTKFFIGGFSSDTSNSFTNYSIAEVIVFEDVHLRTDTSMSRVETYLALKYGMTLENSYVNSYNDTIFNLLSDLAYFNDVAGIAKDDTTGLDQKQSRSINPTSIVTIGLDAIAVANDSNVAGFPNDTTWMVWGHNNGEMCYGNENFAVSTAATDRNHYVRIQREWKVNKFGSAFGNVELHVDINNLNSPFGNLPPGGGRYILALDDDGIYDSASMLINLDSLGSAATDTVGATLASSLFDTYHYFTIGFRLDSVAAEREDYCDGNPIDLYGSHIGDLGVCGYIEINNGIDTYQIFRDAAFSDTTYRVMNNNLGDCLDLLRFEANAAWASDSIYEVTVVMDTTNSVLNPSACGNSGSYTDFSRYVIRDSITLGVGGTTLFNYPGNDTFCLGDTVQIPTGFSSPGTFFPADTSGTGIAIPLPTPGLIGDDSTGALLIHSGVVGGHLICYNLRGYCPSVIPSLTYCDSVYIQPVTPTTFTYDSLKYCNRTSTPAQTIAIPPIVPGLFSSNPPLATLFPPDGNFQPGASSVIPGTYVVTFQPNDSTCYSPSYDTIVIDTPLRAYFSYPPDSFCSFAGEAVPTITFLPTIPGWEFGSFDPTVEVDSINGRVDLALTPPGNNYQIYYAPPANAYCSDTDSVSISVLDLPNVGFVLDTAGYCASAVPINMMPTVFNAATSVFSDPGGYFTFAGNLLTSTSVTGGPLPIVYTRDTTVGSITCTDSMTNLITLTGLPPSLITYPNEDPNNPGNYSFCSGDPNPFPIFSQGPAGGVFTSSNPSLVVDSASGEIQLSGSTTGLGPVTISYTFIAAGCTSSVTVGIVHYGFIQSVPFSLSSNTVCEDVTNVSIVGGLTQGYFISDGGTILQGPVSNSPIPVLGTLQPGVTYTIFNVQTVTPSGLAGSYSCSDTTFQYLQVDPRDVASIDYGTLICSNQGDQNPLINGTGGGIFTTNSPTLNLNPTSGQLTGLDTTNSGQYTVTYTTQGVCPDIQSVNFFILPGRESELSYPKSEVCTKDSFLAPDTTVVPLNTAGDEFFTSVDSLWSALIDDSTGLLDLTVVNQDTTITIFRVVNPNGGLCSDTASFTLTIFVELTNLVLEYGPDFQQDTFCPVDSAVPGPQTFLPNIFEGQFRPQAGLAYQDDSLGIIDLNSTTPDRLYTIEYVRSVGCREKVSTEIYVKSFDDGSFSYASTVYCSRSDSVIATVLPLNSPGTFTATAGLTTTVIVWADSTVGSIDLLNSPPDQYEITFTTGGTCPVAVTQNVEIAEQPEIAPEDFVINPPGASVCGDEIPIFEIQQSGRVTWYVDGIINTVNSQFIYLNPADGALITGVLENSDGCIDSVQATVELKELPDGIPTTYPSVMTGDLPLEIVMAALTDSTSFIWEATSSTNIVLDSTMGHSETILLNAQTTLFNGVTLDSDFNPGNVTYEITPFSDGCFGIPDTLVINVNPNENPIFIPGVMTPNNDMFNDTWLVQWSSDLDPNDYTIYLFNRAGGEVFKMNPIHPNFTGDGLPDGVYWWTLFGPDGVNIDAGGLTIRRR